MPQQLSEILCPVTGEVCPAKQQITQLFIANEGQVDHETATRDRLLFNSRMTEYNLAARMLGCQGLNAAGECSTRERMTESKVRGGIVHALRSLTGHSNS